VVAELFSAEAVAALFAVLAIDLVLAGDNAIVIGMVASRVTPSQRGKVILWGMAAAVIMRITFSVIAVYLLSIVGLMLVGGLLLMWVSWRLYRDITAGHEVEHVAHAVDVATGHDSAAEQAAAAANALPLRDAVFRVAMADLSMSLDNVLAVAAAAREHPWVLILGLLMSIAFMGALANVIARLLQKYSWLSYVGLALIVWVAVDMTYHGSLEVLGALGYIDAPAEAPAAH
jgi:YjbE family integral membrane protein